MSRFIPTVEILGDLPLNSGDLVPFPVPVDIDQQNPKQLLAYAFITLDGVSPGFERGYYEIYTQSNDGVQYKFYLNVAKTSDAVLNSENIWMPYGTDFLKNVYVRLISADGAKIRPRGKEIKSCRGKDGATCMREHAGHGHNVANEVQVGQIFITGYRV